MQLMTVLTGTVFNAYNSCDSITAPWAFSGCRAGANCIGLGEAAGLAPECI